MSLLRGRADPGDASPKRLLALAQALRPLHALAAPSVLPTYRPYVAAASRIVPAWSRFPSAWAQAIEICAGPAPSGPLSFIHRDYHPGNVLVDDGVISGIVDWPNACAGPPEIDIAHCRLNLALAHGLEAATELADAASPAGADPPPSVLGSHRLLRHVLR